MKKSTTLWACIVLCLLSLFMACSELCELASLQDDISNDFTVEDFSGRDQVVAAIVTATLQKLDRETLATDHPWATAVTPVLLTPIPFEDPLQLSAVLRTYSLSSLSLKSAHINS